MKKDIVNIGDRYGMWTIKSEAPSKKINRGSFERYFNCVCDCGTESVVRWYYLKNGHSKSCGCLRRETARKTRRKFPEDAVKSRIYAIWNGIKCRCYTKSSGEYKNYGAKGITMCDEWKNDFTSFYKWSIENGYADNLTIDRINGKGNYEPSNCRWATFKEQANNTRSNVLLSLNNVTHTIAEWSDITGIPKGVIQYRRYKKWSDEKALTTPVKYYKKHFTKEEIEQMKRDKADGMSYRKLGIKYNTDRCIISKFIRGIRK